MNPERWQQIERIYNRALEIDTGQRAAFLEEACAGDASLRKEVERLLARQSQAEHFIESPAIEIAAQALARDQKPGMDTDLVGRTLLHYRIVEKIGEGGMGVVYRAHDEHLLRDVAIKVLPPGAFGDESARKRFRREAVALSKLSHPNIETVHDFDTRDGIDFLVMEYIPGTTLSEKLAAGALPQKEVIGLGMQIAAALEEAHDRGVVHRDLKPANIILTPKGQVKVLDFGLAKLLRPAIETASMESLSETQGVAGTIPYMAPEQLRGEAVDARTDIHAAGAVLYEMCSGRRPYHEDTVPKLTDAILHKAPVALRVLNAGTSPRLEEVILKCLEKEPENRYQSAREMLDALNTVSLSSSTGHAVQTRTVARLIALPFRVLKRDEETDFLAYSLPDAISSSLSGIDSLIVRSSLLAARFEGLMDPKRIATEAGVDAILTGSVMRAGNQFRLTCQLVEAPSATVIWSETVNSSMKDLFKIQDELSERIVQSLMLPLSERERHIFRRDVPASAQGYEFYLRANQIVAKRTLENMRLARDLYLQCLDDDPNYAPAWACLGRVHQFIEKVGEDPDQNFNRADEAFRKAFALNPDLAIAHNLYTPIECDQGRAQQAMVRLLGRARFRRNDPDLFVGLVQACRYCDELEASVAAHHRARQLDPHVSTSVAQTYFLLGDYQKTIECYPPKVAFYLDCAALVMLGDKETALAKLREREQAGGATGVFRAIMQSLRAYLEGDFEGCLGAIEVGESLTRRDPEGLFYTARHLAQINQRERALKILSGVIDSGFLCGSAISGDPWLASLRSLPDYSELLHIADQRRSQAHASFVEAGGPQLLNIT